MSNKDKNNKREKFLKNLSIGVAATAGFAGIAYSTTDSERAKDELSKYAENGNKIVEYADKTDVNMVMQLQMLEEDVKTYNELSSKMFLSDEDKIRLENAKNSIKSKILSEKLSEFYLEDILKEKIKSAYSADYVEVDYFVNSMAEEHMEIDVYEVKPTSKLDKPDITIKKEEIPREVKAAIGCIVDLQEFAECRPDQIGEESIKKAAKYYDSMKGFANLDLKADNGKIKVEKGIER